MARPQFITISKSLFNQGVGRERKLGRSGSVFEATRQEISAFKQKQAKADVLSTPKEVQGQVEKAGKALGTDLSKRVTFAQPKDTVRVGKSGTLQKQTPRPEVQLDGRSVQADVEKAFKGVKGADQFIAGDIGTQLIVAEVARRGGKGRRGLASAQKIAKKGGLKGFEAKRSKFGSFVGGKTLGIPNPLLVVGTAALGAAGGSTTTAGTPASQQAAGQTVFTAPGGGLPFPVPNSIAGTGVTKGLTPLTTSTAGTTAAVTRGGLESAKSSGAIGKTGVASTLDNVRRGVNLVSKISSLLGGASATSATTGTATVSQPQLIIQQQAPQIVQQRQTTTAGAVPSFVRRNRDRFGGTRTSSLFASRGEQFQARRRASLLGGR